MTHKFSFSFIWSRLFILLLMAGYFLPGSLHAEQTQALYLHHTMALSFNLEQGLLNATSKIDIPENRSLRLDVKHLTITGTVLEAKGQTPRLIRTHNGTISLAAASFPQTLYLSWQFQALPPDNLISAKGIALTGAWHPLADQDMLFTLQAALPEGFNGISEGTYKTDPGSRNRMYHTSVPFPLRILHFVAGPYRVHTEKIGNITVSSYFFPEDDHLAHGYLSRAVQFIKQYEKLLGPFPYPSYAIVENRLPTGYGMPGFTLLGQAVVRLPFIKDTSLGHEIVHSWFGNSVGIADGSGNWCEGLTTYLADHSFAEAKGDGPSYRKRQILRYLDYVHQDNTMTLADFRGAGMDHTGIADRKLRAMGYDKSSMFFHMLRQEVGEEKFFQALQTLYREKKFKRASWQDIEKIFTRTSGKDLDVFFQQWLDRRDIPQISLKDASFDETASATRIHFHIVQNSKPPYLLRIPVLITTVTGEKKMTLTCKKADQEFSLTVDALPRSLTLDPDYDIMRSLADDEIPATWARFLGASEKIFLLPDDPAQAAIYQPLADALRTTGIKVIHANELDTDMVNRASILLAGDSSLRKSLFAGYRSPGWSFCLKTKKNPLNQQETMALVDASSADEVRLAAIKLFHYGQYSLLVFQKGKVIQKETETTVQGIQTDLLPPPSGIPTPAIENFQAIIRDISSSRVIYAGEMHTSYGDHLLQLQIIEALYAKNKKLVIGMEMFPRAAQSALDEYINGTIHSELEFLEKSNYFSVWGFDYRYYRGILNFARKHSIPVIGLNLDKDIVSKVFKTGNLDALSDEELAQMAMARDLSLPGYRKRLHNVFGRHQGALHSGRKQFTGFLQAQAIWDETMAESISLYLQKNPTKQMIVIAGAGHVYKDSAIPPRVARRIPGIRQSVLISNNGFDTGRARGKAVDFLMFSPPFELPPAPKIGIILEEKNKDQDNEKTQLIISGISPHGNAAKAGLLTEDIILSIDNVPVHSIGELKYLLLDKDKGDKIKLLIKRKTQIEDASEKINITVTLSTFPAPR